MGLRGNKQLDRSADGSRIGDLPTEVRRRNKMLWTIALVLIVLWVLGLVSSYTMGGFIHALLVIAVIVIVIQIIQGRRS
jgi:hypothetical protein